MAATHSLSFTADSQDAAPTMRTLPTLPSNDLKSREDVRGTVVRSSYSLGGVRDTGPLYDGSVCIGEV